MRATFLALFLASACADAVRAADSPAKTAPPPATVPAAYAKLTPAQWIWAPPAKGDGGTEETVWFRKEFMQRGGSPSARVYVVGTGEARVFVDGELVVTHTGLEKIGVKDATAFFNREVPGDKHVFAVAVKQPRTAQRKPDRDTPPPGLLVSVVFESGWKDPWAIPTDGSWIVSRDAASGWEQVDFDSSKWQKAQVVGTLGDAPWPTTAAVLYGSARFAVPRATPVSDLRVAKDFRVELLYSVPKESQGSWVNLCVDPRGRLYVSDQYGGLYRLTIPAAGRTGEPKIETVPVALGEAQGLLWAFDSLYVVVNRTTKVESGLYRVRDTDGDDVLDRFEKLQPMEGVGEHGPHAVIPTPDGKSLVVVCGNTTVPIPGAASRVPKIWDEDQLLPRIYGRGFMRGVPPPGGAIYKVDPDGKRWERIASGFRNPFDVAFDADGELFTYDADMEWDFNTPWYRPTRVCHVVSGSDWGWRNGSAKWPVHYPDTLPPVVDVGPGSPTGICFGHGTKFPAKYQHALYLCDWSYGKLYAAHLKPDGASHSGTLEEFVTGTPLPLTDVVVHPGDGALYFTIGGRKVQSGLYRVTYAGPLSTAPVDHVPVENPARTLRRRLEELHRPVGKEAVETVWPHLGHEDRFVRHAARTVLEHQPSELWKDRALRETDAAKALPALLALVRTIPRPERPKGADLDSPPPTYPADSVARHPLHGPVLDALAKFDFARLTPEERILLIRTTGMVLYRTGPPDETRRRELTTRFDAVYPSASREENGMLTELLVLLQAPSVAAKGTKLLTEARTQEEQIDFARSLRFLEAGWTPETRRIYAEWFARSRSYSGGANFAQFLKELQSDAESRMPAGERTALKDLLDAPPAGPRGAAPARPFVRKWTMDELAPLVETKLRGRDFEKGRALFAAVNCFGCHRYANEGGAAGPDLTSLAGRFSRRDILESVLEPSKVVSDQYAAVQIVTTEGKVVVGRIVNLAGDVVHVNTNMLDPSALTSVDRKLIDEMFPAKTSMMPAGLLDTLHEDEVLDLMAFLLSRGDRRGPMFAGGR